MKIASLAESHSLKYLPHAWDPGLGWLHNLHLAVSQSKNLTEYIETPLDPEWWLDTIFSMTDEKPEIVDGYVELPDKPGLGMEINFEKIKEYII